MIHREVGDHDGNGRSSRIRTCDPCVPNAVLYQTEPYSVAVEERAYSAGHEGTQVGFFIPLGKLGDKFGVENNANPVAYKRTGRYEAHLSRGNPLCCSCWGMV